MANPFKKFWDYLMALFDNKIEENADPKVQIEQAINEAQRQHQALSQQAAAVIGNQRQIEMQLNRRLEDVEKLQANTRQALQLADKARADGDEKKAQEYENAAEAFAAQLVTAEQGVEDTKQLHDQALQQAAAAKQAVERNAAQLQQQVAERSKLLSQLEQAKMQEKVTETMQQMNSITSTGPNLDQVRDKIERRYANALGAAELAENSVEGRMAEVEQAGIQMAGHGRLEQIRAEMSGELTSGEKPAIEQSGSTQSGVASQSGVSRPVGADVDNDAVAQRMRELRGES